MTLKTQGEEHWYNDATRFFFTMIYTAKDIVQDGSSCQDVIGGNIDPRMKWLSVGQVRGRDRMVYAQAMWAQMQAMYVRRDSADDWAMAVVVAGLRLGVADALMPMGLAVRSGGTSDLAIVWSDNGTWMLAHAETRLPALLSDQVIPQFTSDDVALFDFCYGIGAPLAFIWARADRPDIWIPTMFKLWIDTIGSTHAQTRFQELKPVLDMDRIARGAAFSPLTHEVISEIAATPNGQDAMGSGRFITASSSQSRINA
jgi:hypothetical protein